MNDNLQSENKQIIIAKPWEELACDNCKHCVDDDMCTAYPLEFSLGYCPTIINCREHIKRPENEEFNNIISENTELKARLEKAIELPYKVGDTVWVNIAEHYISIPKGITKGVVIRFCVIDSITKPGTSDVCIIVRFKNSYGVTDVPFDLIQFNKIIFISKEEAEATKERIENEMY